MKTIVNLENWLVMLLSSVMVTASGNPLREYEYGDPSEGFWRRQVFNPYDYPIVGILEIRGLASSLKSDEGYLGLLCYNVKAALDVCTKAQDDPIAYEAMKELHNAFVKAYRCSLDSDGFIAKDDVIKLSHTHCNTLTGQVLTYLSEWKQLQKSTRQISAVMVQAPNPYAEFLLQVPSPYAKSLLKVPNGHEEKWADCLSRLKQHGDPKFYEDCLRRSKEDETRRFPKTVAKEPLSNACEDLMVATGSVVVLSEFFKSGECNLDLSGEDIETALDVCTKAQDDPMAQEAMKQLHKAFVEACGYSLDSDGFIAKDSVRKISHQFCNNLTSQVLAHLERWEELQKSKRQISQ